MATWNEKPRGMGSAGGDGSHPPGLVLRAWSAAERWRSTASRQGQHR